MNSIQRRILAVAIVIFGMLVWSILCMDGLRARQIRELEDRVKLLEEK